jgi:hypothetical protein
VCLVVVSDTDPDLRSAVDLRVTEIIENQLLAGTEDWEGVPGQQGTWSIQRRLEFHDHNGKARLVLDASWRAELPAHLGRRHPEPLGARPSGLPAVPS